MTERSLFRIYRDTRFSKDKTPYKTHAAAVVEGTGSAGSLYVQLGAEGLYVGGGSWHTASDQVQLVIAHILEGQLVRRAAVEGAEVGDRAHVDLARADGHIAEPHVVKHPLPQRRD